MSGDAAARLRGVDWNALDGLGPLCIDALTRVLEGQSAERSIDRLLRSNRKLSSSQRTAVVEAIFGVALWRRRLAAHASLDWHDDDAARTVAPHATTLLCSLLRDLGGVDDARAVELSGAAQPPAQATPRTGAERNSFPDWLWSLLAEELGADALSANHLNASSEAEQFAQHVSRPGPVFLRANRLRTDRSALASILGTEGIETTPCTYARDGLRVKSARPNLLASPAYRAGLFEVQDEGSQLLGELLEAAPGETVLDLCAGAGGKSMQLAAAVGLHGRVICTDPDRSRLDRLRVRAERAGARCIELLDSLAPGLLVDRVLVDAPCSELGTLRRGPDARWRIDRTSLCTLPALQSEILARAATHVRPGGRLVYATCTIRRAENEEVADAFERSQSQFISVEPGAGWLDRSFAYKRFFLALPHRHDTDGFFAAAWIRRA